jgi:hypothetical protein
VNIVVALLFGRIKKRIDRSFHIGGRWQKSITASVLIALGIKIALSSRK